MTGLTIICCTRGAKEATDLFASLGSLPPLLDVRFIENNRTGLAARYNAALDEFRDADRIIAFVHDDVAIDDPLIDAKLNTGLGRGYVISGLAGQSAFSINHRHAVSQWLQPVPDAQSGRVRHRHPDGSCHVAEYGPIPKRCVVLDGLFLAVHPPSLRGVRFDERFAFHFYDIDFCLTAAKAGLVMGTTDVAVTHREKPGGGGFDTLPFREAQAVFRAKWGEGYHFAEAPQAFTHLNRNDLCYCGSGRRYKHCHGQALTPLAG
jgi:GT2 family glycosyltransferase